MFFFLSKSTKHKDASSVGVVVVGVWEPVLR